MSAYSPENSLIPPLKFDVIIGSKTYPMVIGVFERPVDSAPVFTIAYQKPDDVWYSDAKTLQRELSQTWVDEYDGMAGYVQAHIDSWNDWLKLIDPEEEAPKLEGLFLELSEYLAANLTVVDERLVVK